MLPAIQKHTCSISTITGQTFGVEERRVEPETMAKERHINVAFFVLRKNLTMNSKEIQKKCQNVTKILQKCFNSLRLLRSPCYNSMEIYII